ncbi:MAG: response regulator [Spirochaetaceae bacterium]|nr:MAG: response regulator [Spirochaetaceae bacterium]
MSESRKILVVDDDVDIVDQVTEMMESDGHSVVAAYSREEAEEALLTQIPDLAIVDLMMEHMDSGFVLCHHIKKLYPQTPIIILTSVSAKTGLDFRADTAEFRSWMEADVFIDKPVRPGHLKNEVLRLLST